MTKSGGLTFLGGPHLHHHRVNITGTGAKEVPVWFNDHDHKVRVTKVTYTPQAAVTGNDTNNFTLALTNKALVGVGTTVIATKLFDTGEDMVAFDGEDIPLVATVADREVAPGESLSANKTVAGSGLALPEGVLTIQYEFIGR